METFKEALVLFSGGRDSSAATVEMIRRGYKVKLFTYQAGLPELTGPHNDSAPDIRHKELLSIFPEHIGSERTISGNAYLIRKLAIEKTNVTHVVYPFALALAVHSNAIIHCLKTGISDVACGYSSYQAREDRYIEQREDFFERSKAFFAEYNITFHAPVIQKSKEEIIDILEQVGISSNSLENKSLFGAVPFSTDKALDFWNESLPICRDYIVHMRSFEKI